MVEPLGGVEGRGTHHPQSRPTSPASARWAAIFFLCWLLKGKRWAQRIATFLTPCFGRVACPSVGSSDPPVTTTSPTAFFLFEKSFQPRLTHSPTAFCVELTHLLPDPSSPSHP